MKPFASTLLASAAAVALLGYGSVASSSPVVAATPPPTPPPVSAPGPLASPTSLAPPNGPQIPLTSPSPGATPTPPAVVRKGLEGVWEVAIQHPDTTDYTHFRLAPQSGSTLTGTYLDTKGKRYPLAGSVDGQAIRLIVTMSDGTTLLMEGRLDGTTDIIGMLTTPKEQIPFTAAYRPKEKWIENVNPAPGGFGMPNAGGGPSGGGGYPPPR
ncbi:MAG TPA: hypothetical protein VGG89_02910 [Candidatus Baltobacteraceae bacterium]